MKYGILETETMFAFVDNELERLKTTIKFLPGYSEADICGYSDSQIELGYDGRHYISGHAPAKPHKEIILEQIAQAESKQTARIMRGAALGNSEDILLLNAIETQIQSLREQL